MKNNRIPDISINILTYRTDKKILDDCIKSINISVPINIIENLKIYPYISDQMCREYELLFLSLHNISLSTNRNTKKVSKSNRLKLKIKKFINLKIYNLIRKNKLWN